MQHRKTYRTPARVGFSLSALVVLLAAVMPAGAQPSSQAALLESLPRMWRDDNNQAFDLYGLHGRAVVLTMAYATCHRICPMTMQRLERMQTSFDARRVDAEFVIVGYDPENDDPAAWRRYRRSRHLTRPNWHFLVGSTQQVNDFARALAFDFWKADEHVMHDQRVLYLDPRGTLQLDPSTDEPRAALKD